MGGSRSTVCHERALGARKMLKEPGYFGWSRISDTMFRPRVLIRSMNGSRRALAIITVALLTTITPIFADPPGQQDQDDRRKAEQQRREHEQQEHQQQEHQQQEHQQREQ